MDQQDRRDLDAIEQKWGSEDALLRFIDEQIQELCPLICGFRVSLPIAQVKPSWLARGLLGNQHAAADYEPAENDRPAVISIFPVIISDEQVLRTAIAHELIHHWEHQSPTIQSDIEYPEQADVIITRKFSGTSTRESRWRSGHSRRFITKAAVVSQQLDVSLDRLLFC